MSNKMADKTLELVKHDEDVFPVEGRRCTDVAFLFLILSTWICVTFIGLSAMGVIHSEVINQGNPKLLTHGVDYMGNICGVDSPVQHLSKKVYPNFDLTTVSSTSDYVPALFAVCVESCPSAGDTITDPYGTYGSWVASDDSRDFLNACLFSTESAGNTSLVTLLSDLAQTAMLIGLLGFVLACILSLCFLLIVRIPLLLRLVVWSCALLVQLLLSVGGLFFLYQSSQRNGGYSTLCHCSTEVVLLKTVGGVLLVCAILWASILGFWRSRIALAISLVRESAAALTYMPLICFLPLLQTALYVGVTAVLLLYAVYLATSGQVHTVTDSITGISYSYLTLDVPTQRAMVLVCFTWLWSIGWLESVGMVSSAHAVSAWYFAPHRREITSGQILRSVGVVARYHAGSAAAGSLVISLLRFLRVTVTYLTKVSAPPRGLRSEKSPLCLRCLHGMLACIQYCVQFFTKHAFIYVAITGQSFFPAAGNAFLGLRRGSG
ncbi:CTL/SLC44 family protein [archaeon]|nr:MAG: CTL/SLC44 family protein [archaeon]